MTSHDSDRYDTHRAGPRGADPSRALPPVRPGAVAVPRRSPLMVRAARALSGAVAAGLVILCLVVIGSAYVGGGKGFPGPGAVSITAHVVGAVIAIVAQRVADRRDGLGAVVASLLVIVVAALLLVTQWWG
ncbi:MAG: hypothetical protein WAW17_23685 [Rhodococcus sp. (in: high G+C Gram-positive bacteria)]|uniref:hypothetical protein n=1 Tax=Rhodococcus sp. TaxID=1831 RepID=UPI003BAF3C34